MKAELQMEKVTDANAAELDRACRIEDGHLVPPSATHLFRRDNGDIVSALSLFSPVAMFWAHSRKMKAADSVPHLRRCRALALAKHPKFLVACSNESPYRPYLEKHFGFRLLGGVDVFDYPLTVF